MKKLLFIAVAAALFSANIWGQQLPLENEADTEEKKSDIKIENEIFRLSPVTDSLLLGGGLVLSGTDLLCGKILHTKNTTFSGQTFSRDNLTAVDALFTNHYSKPADYISTGLEVTALLAPALLFTTDNSQWLKIGVMYTETLLWAYGLKEAGKLLVSRARPYMYFSDYPVSYVEDGDWNCSFFSGHSTMSFAAASFTSYVFCTYFPDSKWKTAVIAGTYSIAAVTAVLRVAAGCHFVTDVLTGALTGTAVGLLVPFCHTISLKLSNKNHQVDISPAGLSFRYQF